MDEYILLKPSTRIKGVRRDHEEGYYHKNAYDPGKYPIDKMFEFQKPPVLAKAPDRWNACVKRMSE